MTNQDHSGKSLRLFDCHTLMGMSIKPPLAPALTAEDLLLEMDRCGVDEALVNSDAAELSSPLATNRQIAEACAPHARLHPVWNILPAQTGEMELAGLFTGMKEHGVRTLRANPSENRFLLNGITFSPLFEAMTERRIPLFLQSDWPRITGLLNEFPKLTVIATDIGSWGTDRYFRPLLDRFENFCVEISSYELDGGIKALVEKYGPGRVLFGSGFHRLPMAGAALMLRNLDINDECKALIAHGNIERLLKETQL